MTTRMIRISDGKLADIHHDEVQVMLAYGWQLVDEDKVAEVAPTEKRTKRTKRNDGDK